MRGSRKLKIEKGVFLRGVRTGDSGLYPYGDYAKEREQRTTVYASYGLRFAGPAL